MKIKKDFVTNSSSCSFIVCIPNMEKFIEKYEKIHKLTFEIKKILRESSNSDLIDFDPEEKFEISDFFEFHNLVEKLGYVLFEDYSGRENRPRYLNVGYSIDKIKKIISENA